MLFEGNKNKSLEKGCVVLRTNVISCQDYHVCSVFLGGGEFPDFLNFQVVGLPKTPWNVRSLAWFLLLDILGFSMRFYALQTTMKPVNHPPLSNQPTTLPLYKRHQTPRKPRSPNWSPTSRPSSRVFRNNTRNELRRASLLGRKFLGCWAW